MQLATRAVIAVIVVIASAAALLLAGCGGAASGPERTVTVTMRDIGFEPATIAMRTGERMRLDLRNDGALVHDFTIETMPIASKSTKGGMTAGQHAHDAGRFALHLALEGGKQGEARFTASKAGEYTYYCTVPGHREAGMQGTIRVE